MDSIEICFQGFTNDVVGLNESIFYCQKIFWQKSYYLESFCMKVYHPVRGELNLNV